MSTSRIRFLETLRFGTTDRVPYFEEGIREDVIRAWRKQGLPKGKNPSDVWEIVQKDWEKEIWDIPNVKSNHREKTEHPCQYPIELVERCILALTNEKSWILDPFAGVGSSLLAAYLSNRNAVGIEIHKRYIDIGLDRLKLLRNRQLRYRRINTPVYDHKKSKLSKNFTFGKVR